jgi:hypothetical protein
LEEEFDENPEFKEKLWRRDKVGRPKLEEDQPELLKAIISIATFRAGADERRRSETLRTVRTLDELTSELQAQGFKVRL